MNKIFRTLAVLGAMTATMTAMADNVMVVHTTTGQVPFALPTIQRLTLGDNALSVWAGSEQQFVYPEIEKIGFTMQKVGDVNGDGVVDVKDVNQVINVMLGKNITSELLVACDVNGDKQVDVIDVNAIINAMLGKSTATETQSTTADRMVVHRADGTIDIYVVDQLTDIKFAQIAQATTTITLSDADESSVRARVVMTEGTKRYEVACYAASETPGDIEAYIQANKKFNRKKDGAVEFVDLTPSTPYVIAALAYDEYDLPCEVSTLEFTTAERTISEPARIGDFLYRDGSWSTELKSNKTPVGIVYSLTPTDADRAQGYTNGYAIALTDAGTKVVWSVEGGENESGTSIEGEQYVADRDGLTHTQSLLADAEAHPAAQAASNYDVKPYATSGWYLPAIGQWVELLKNLGQLTDEDLAMGENGQVTCQAQTAAAAVERINAMMARAGQNSYTPLNQTYYWSSSERSMMSAYYMFYNPNYYLSLMTYYKNGQFAVRPVVAF
ncbi:MAG: hypothetical protein IJ724_03465 [Muribaculaceae bacterium]|nr:hypothetical protein [Muribaculaceae bacterium]